MACFYDNPNPEAIKVLLDAGADMASRNNEGDTALQVARKKNHVGALELLERASKRRYQSYSLTMVWKLCKVAVALLSEQFDTMTDIALCVENLQRGTSQDNVFAALIITCLVLTLLAELAVTVTVDMPSQPRGWRRNLEPLWTLTFLRPAKNTWNEVMELEAPSQLAQSQRLHRSARLSLEAVPQCLLQTYVIFEQLAESDLEQKMPLTSLQKNDTPPTNKRHIPQLPISR